MSRRNSTPESQPTPRNNEQAARYEDRSYEAVSGSLQTQLERISALAKEWYGEDHDPTADDSVAENGSEFPERKSYFDFLEATIDRQEALSDDEILAVMYFDSVLSRNEAYQAMDLDKIANRNLNGEALSEENESFAVRAQLLKVASNQNKRNKTLAARVESRLMADGEPATDAYVREMKRLQKVNRGVLNDAFAAAEEMKATDVDDRYDTASAYFTELTARMNGEPQLDDEAFATTRDAVIANTQLNIRSARAYANLAGKDFQKQGSAYDPFVVGQEVKELAGAMNNMFIHRGMGEAVLANDEPGNEESVAAVINQAQAEVGQGLAGSGDTADADEAGTSSAADDEDPPLVSSGTPRGASSTSQTTSSARTRPASPASPAPQQTTPASRNARTRGQATPAGPTPPSNNGGVGSGAQGNPPTGGSGGNTQQDARGGNGNPNTRERAENPDDKVTRRHLQEMRVLNAAAALQESALRRSKLSGEGSAFDDESTLLHLGFAKEAYQLLQFDRPAVLNHPDTTPEEKNAFISDYIFQLYNKVTHDTIEDMGGEKDPAKRKRNARSLRIAGAVLGGLLGGPAGVMVGGSIGFGISKGLDASMESRQQLYGAVQRHEAQFAADDYLNKQDRAGEAYSEKAAFFAAAANLHQSFEKGLVRQSTINKGKAALKGVLWGAGALVVSHEAAAAAQYMGDVLYQKISILSWQGTGVPWDGGLNPNFNYTMHEKPVSMKILGGLFHAATPGVATAVGVGGIAAFIGLRTAGDGGDSQKKKKKKRESVSA